MASYWNDIENYVEKFKRDVFMQIAIGARSVGTAGGKS